MRKFFEFYRGYRRDGFGFAHSVKGALLWSGALRVEEGDPGF